MEYPLASAEVVVAGAIRVIVATDKEGARRRVERADMLETTDGATGYVTTPALTNDDELQITSSGKQFSVGPSRIRHLSAARHLRFRDDEQRKRFAETLFKRGGYDPRAPVPDNREDRLRAFVLASLRDAIWDNSGEARVSEVMRLASANYALVEQALLAAKGSEAEVDQWIVTSPTDATDADDLANGDAQPGIKDKAQQDAVVQVLRSAAGFRRIPNVPDWRGWVRENGRRAEPTLAESTLWDVSEFVTRMPLAKRHRSAVDDDYWDAWDDSPIEAELPLRFAHLVSGLDLGGARITFSLLRAIVGGPSAVDRWLQSQKRATGSRRIVRR